MCTSDIDHHIAFKLTCYRARRLDRGRLVSCDERRVTAVLHRGVSEATVPKWERRQLPGRVIQEGVRNKLLDQVTHTQVQAATIGEQLGIDVPRRYTALDMRELVGQALLQDGVCLACARVARERTSMESMTPFTFSHTTLWT